MLIDNLKPGSIDQEEVQAEFCIIGGGPAGITLALALGGAGREVVMLESGGLFTSDIVHDLCKGEAPGMKPQYMESSRARYLGGSSGHWGGFCTPYHDDDMRAREWVPLSGWPIQYRDLDAYYRRAHVMCDLGKYNYDPNDWLRGQLRDMQLPGIDLNMWQNSVWRPEMHVAAPTHFGFKYAPDLQKSPHIRVLLNTTATHLQLSADGARMDHVQCATLEGKRMRVRAKQYILACGTLENTRLLLHADDVQPQGIGNTHDWLGRCFMEHVEWDIGHIIYDTRTMPAAPFARFQAVGNTWVRCALTLSKQLQERHQLLSNAFRLSTPEAFDKKCRDIADWMHFSQPLDAPPGHYAASGLYVVPEHSPCRDSRLSLLRERDKLGMRRLRLDIAYNSDDRERLMKAMRVLSGQLAAYHRARFIFSEDWQSKPSPYQQAWFSCHPAGTIRMAETEKEGVVDRNGQVFGVGNLYVTGSSVFPSHAWKVPTMTIVALSLRLGDHLLSGKA